MRQWTLGDHGRRRLQVVLETAARRAGWLVTCAVLGAASAIAVSFANSTGAQTGFPIATDICAGDCDANGMVTAAEVATCQDIFLGNAPPGSCPQCDVNQDGHVSSDEVAAAAASLANGCPDQPCTGDCDGDHTATIDEVMTLVNIALGNAEVSACLVGDRGGDGQITIDEIIVAVQNVLTGCPSVEPGFAITGTVKEFPGCMGYMRGVAVVLNPLGRTTETLIGPDPAVAGTFSFQDVPPGDYTLTISPSCNPYGCWPPTSVRVVAQDVSVQICNVSI